MTRPGSSDGRRATAGQPGVEADVIDYDDAGGAPRRRRGWILGLLGVVVLLVAAYLVQTTTTPAPVPTPTPPRVEPPLENPLASTGGHCSNQTGTTLQLGIEIVNQSDAAVTLNEIDAVLPLPGLHPVSSAWGDCDSDSAIDGANPFTLGAGAKTWVTMTFEVQVQCPAPLPMQFKVGYLQHGQQALAALGGFPDLESAHYSGCPEETG